MHNPPPPAQPKTPSQHTIKIELASDKLTQQLTDAVMTEECISLIVERVKQEMYETLKSDISKAVLDEVSRQHLPGGRFY